MVSTRFVGFLKSWFLAVFFPPLFLQRLAASKKELPQRSRYALFVTAAAAASLDAMLSYRTTLLKRVKRHTSNALLVLAESLATHCACAVALYVYISRLGFMRAKPGLRVYGEVWEVRGLNTGLIIK